jgi:C-terminal processing protease CtpA/Prc
VLADDGQPIEGRGITPTIDIRSPDWKKQLQAYFNYPELVNKLEELIK